MADILLHDTVTALPVIVWIALIYAATAGRGEVRRFDRWVLGVSAYRDALPAGTRGSLVGLARHARRAKAGV